MAETVVISLIDRLVPLLTQEAKLLRGIHGEVADIKDELDSIQSFLKDADARVAAEEDTSEGVKTWVKQVREVAFRIDVAIDRYLLAVAQHDPHRRGFTGFVHKTAHLLKTLKPRRKMASEIQEIKASFQKIKERSDRYHFKYISARNARWHDPRIASLFLDDADVVGIESPRDELISWLVKGQSHRTIVSVVGMGGLGKTTLAKKVYDHKMVRRHFDCHAWITVSQSYNVVDLLRIMIKQFCETKKEFPPEGIDSTDKISVISKAKEYLEEKRISSHVEVHALQPLPHDKAWELFCKRAFQFEFGGQCPEELENLSHDIIQKCKGLTLAIVSIGGLLSTKEKTAPEWQKLFENLGSELGRNPHLAGVNKIISFSFKDLPYNLKSCLFYLSVYPEDYSIKSARLIRQWIVEGFVKEIEGKTLEEVAYEHLIELIHRSLVQVSMVSFDGFVRKCQLHDLLREIILQKMKDLSFCHVLSKQESNFEGLTRRISLNEVSYNVLKGFKDKHIHSLLLFNHDELPRSFMSTFFANFKLLKVIDFENAPLDHIPKNMGILFNLRFLSLRNTNVKMLPKSIGNLGNLETLDLRQSLVYDIPVEINKLHKLRHILVYYCDNKINFSLAYGKGVKIHKGVGCLKELQKLYHVELNHGGVDLIEELGKWKLLKKLGVKNLSKQTMRALCDSIEKMNHLQTLYIFSINEDEIIDLQYISSPPHRLQRLYLLGRLHMLPDWILKLQHLVRLRILWSRLNDDPLKALQNLPNLLELVISRQAYNGKQLHFKKGGFPKLKVLFHQHLDELNSLIIDQEALPLLEKFFVGPSPQLKEVPSVIQYLRKLVELEFCKMPKEFGESLDPKYGPYYSIIEHIPLVYLSSKVGTGTWDYDFHILHSKHVERSRRQTINQIDDHKDNDIDRENSNASAEKDLDGK